ncbi:hypothetical protein K439DRAFT_1328597 [Ramaria rubella]|nr:hypothetical protein K439DRAFT_1328597 [Ramaria rubella]
MTGLGFYIPSLNFAFYSSVPHETIACHIFFYEALCVVSALLFAAESSTPPCRLLIYTDSMDAVEIFHSLKAY